MWILGLNGLNLLVISKKNSVLIFELKIFLKNTITDQNLTFPFKKHEIFCINLEARAPQLKCLGDQWALSFRPGSPSLNVWESEGLPEIFPRAQPCKLCNYWKYDT